MLAAGIRIFLVFLMIYNISFVAAPSLSTGRVAMAVVFVLHWQGIVKKAREVISENGLPLLLIMLCFIWAFILFLNADYQDSTQISRFFHFFLYVVLGAVAFAELCKYKENAFLTSFGISTFVQAVFIFYALFSPGFRGWTYSHLVQLGNIELDDAFRVAGFSNSSGALLSLIQGLGVISLLYMTFKATSTLKGALLLGMAIFTLLSTIPTGRTGLMLGVTAFVIFLFFSLARKDLFKKFCAVIFIALCLSAFFHKSILSFYENTPRLDTIAEWAFELFLKRDSASVRDLDSMPVPPLSIMTVTGTGEVSAPDGRNSSGNDSGYIQLYYSIGLPMAATFYLALAAMLISYAVKKREKWLYVAIPLMFLLEIKEPFIFKYVVPFYILSIVMCRAGGAQRMSVQSSRK